MAGLDELRLFLHLLSACVWVGGQLVLGALVPVLRRASPEAPSAAARQFSRVAWPAFAVLVLTGVWNVVAAGEDDGDYQAVLGVKLVVVALSGAAAAAHARVSTARARGVLGGVSALTAVAALALGVVLRG